MRIISGKYRGRVLDGYNIDGTRPTMDRVKESLIGMVQTKLKGATCLDLFTGSGSVGLEFISNGAKEAYLIDNNFKVIEVLNKNVKKLNPDEKINVMKSDYLSALDYFKRKNIKFDIIFLDPPYKLGFYNPAINLIKENNLLTDNGIIICEYENEKIDPLDYKIIKEKRYGSKYIMVLENNN